MDQERILVCVNYGKHGKRLIERGASIAEKLNCPLSILIFDALSEQDYKHDKSIDMPMFQEIADKCDGELIIKKSNAHNITKVITETAKKVGATQIIIGQTTESLWTALVGGSIIDILLEDVPEADLHVVPKLRADEPEEWEFEPGVYAYLDPQPDGTYELSFKHDEHTFFEGVFFKHFNTDFDNGIFAFEHEKKLYEVRVKDGTVSKLVDIDEEK